MSDATTPPPKEKWVFNAENVQKLVEMVYGPQPPKPQAPVIRQNVDRVMEEIDRVYRETGRDLIDEAEQQWEIERERSLIDPMWRYR